MNLFSACPTCTGWVLGLKGEAGQVENVIIGEGELLPKGDGGNL